MEPEQLNPLLEVLAESRQRGFLGPGPLEPHVQGALAMLDLIPTRFEWGLDLGSGGGLPGLPLALATPESHWVLLDGSVTRTGFLRRAVIDLGLAGRVEVITARAEDAGRGSLRGTLDLVVARSFGPPAVTAEAAAPLLRVGGRLVVAEPPGGAVDRWPTGGLQILGLEVGPTTAEPYAFQVLHQTHLCPERYPRRVGIPAKRPLF